MCSVFKVVSNRPGLFRPLPTTAPSAQCPLWDNTLCLRYDQYALPIALGRVEFQQPFFRPAMQHVQTVKLCCSCWPSTAELILHRSFDLIIREHLSRCWSRSRTASHLHAGGKAAVQTLIPVALARSADNLYPTEQLKNRCPIIQPALFR
jgi:hypothetical protein